MKCPTNKIILVSPTMVDFKSNLRRGVVGVSGRSRGEPSSVQGAAKDMEVCPNFDTLP